MLDLFDEAKTSPGTLAEAISRLQEEARDLRSKLNDDDWERFLALTAKDARSARQSADMTTLLKAAVENETPRRLTPEQLAHWKKLAEQSGSSSHFA
jgi:uncharacterized alpha-E superfamily protein